MVSKNVAPRNVEHLGALPVLFDLWSAIKALQPPSLSPAGAVQTDEEFGKADNAALVGTTAVVALVGDRQLYIGNCGVHLFEININCDSLNF